VAVRALVTGDGIPLREACKASATPLAFVAPSPVRAAIDRRLRNSGFLAPSGGL
jgi:hypothetical protein